MKQLINRDLGGMDDWVGWLGGWVVWLALLDFSNGFWLVGGKKATICFPHY
jgi:hypothetical protein